MQVVDQVTKNMYATLSNEAETLAPVVRGWSSRRGHLIAQLDPTQWPGVGG